MAQTKTKTKKKIPTTGMLNVVLVWDKSGSMQPLRLSAVEGATSYISDLLKDKNAKKIRMSITAFDTSFNRWFEDLPLGEIPLQELSALYQPEGWTALNDAVADTIFSLDKKMAEGERALVVVLTDGLENSSQEYGGFDGTQALANLIKEREATGHWTFIYLGAGKPAEVAAVAATYNIARGNTMSYAHTSEGVHTTSVAMAASTSALAGSARGQTSTAFADAGLESVEEQEKK